MRGAPRLLTTAVLACLLGAAGCGTVRPGATTVRVGIIGDQTGAVDRAAAYGVLDTAVQRLIGEQVAVVLHTGDLVESRVDEAAYRADFARAATSLARLERHGIAWYVTAGDHDVSPETSWDAGSMDRRRETLFRQLYGAIRPVARERLYYSFDAAGYHFVALYSHDVLNADPRWGRILLAGLGEDQLRWLADDLERHRTARGIVVFLHQPLWYAWPRWSAVHELLRRYPVIAVVSGHFHYNQDDGTLDGIRYVTVGATGADTKRGARRAGDLQHVTVLTLRERHVRFDVLPLDGGAPMSLTPRIDMDRLQMLDLVLDGLGTFSETNPVFRKGGALLADCRTGAPARLTLGAVGNPLDVPLDVSLRVTTPGLALADAAFTPGACVSTRAGEHCRLAPGARIKIANLSSVDFTWGCGFCDLPAPVWSGVPTLGGGGAAPETLTMDVRLAFAGASGELFLERAVSTTIQACP